MLELVVLQSVEEERDQEDGYGYVVEMIALVLEERQEEAIREYDES